MPDKPCPDCGKRFPAHLLTNMAIAGQNDLHYVCKCPLCALRIRNHLAGLPDATGFRAGSGAARMHRDAVEHLKRTSQTERTEK